MVVVRPAPVASTTPPPAAEDEIAIVVGFITTIGVPDMVVVLPSPAAILAAGIVVALGITTTGVLLIVVVVPRLEGRAELPGTGTAAAGEEPASVIVELGAGFPPYPPTLAIIDPRAVVVGVPGLAGSPGCVAAFEAGVAGSTVLAFPGSTGEAGAGTCVVVGGSGTTVEAGGTGAVVEVVGAGGSTVCFGAEGELVDTGCAVGKSVVVGNGSTDVEVVPGAGPGVS